MSTFRASSDEKAVVVTAKASSSSTSSKKELLEELKQTTKDYVAKERTRLKNEASVLKAILRGRTGGAGIQSLSNSVVASAAKKDLASYLG